MFEPIELMRFQRCRPASCLARSSEAPNMTGYCDCREWLKSDVLVCGVVPGDKQRKPCLGSANMLINRMEGGMGLFAVPCRRRAHCFRSGALTRRCRSRHARNVRRLRPCHVFPYADTPLPTNSSISARERDRMRCGGRSKACPSSAASLIAISKDIKYEISTYALTAFWASQPWLLSTRTAAVRSICVKLMNWLIAAFCCAVYAGGILCQRSCMSFSCSVTAW